MREVVANPNLGSIKPDDADGREVRNKYAASFLARRPSRLIAAVFAVAAAAGCADWR